jgi:hypothetical protein
VGCLFGIVIITGVGTPGAVGLCMDESVGRFVFVCAGEGGGGGHVEIVWLQLCTK